MRRHPTAPGAATVPSPGPPKKTEQVRKVQLPPQNPVRFTYDANGQPSEARRPTRAATPRPVSLEPAVPAGNPRLVAAEKSGTGILPVNRSRLTFVYDHQGRRRTKKLFTWDETGQAWVLSETHTYLYDAWNVICEQVTLAGGQTSNRYYVWGLDLSNSLQGAGGVGGLLAAYTPDGEWFYCYDGNGNVTTLVNTADGAISATYDYSPFGLTVAQTGPATDANTYRFSTKWQDETGLYYYGYRCYDAGIGRWIKRDPAGEAGFALRNETCFIKGKMPHFAILNMIQNIEHLSPYIARRLVDKTFLNLLFANNIYLNENHLYRTADNSPNQIVDKLGLYGKSISTFNGKTDDNCCDKDAKKKLIDEAIDQLLELAKKSPGKVGQISKIIGMLKKVKDGWEECVAMGVVAKKCQKFGKNPSHLGCMSCCMRIYLKFGNILGEIGYFVCQNRCMNFK